MKTGLSTIKGEDGNESFHIPRRLNESKKGCINCIPPLIRLSGLRQWDVESAHDEYCHFLPRYLVHRTEAQRVHRTAGGDAIQIELLDKRLEGWRLIRVRYIRKHAGLAGGGGKVAQCPLDKDGHLASRHVILWTVFQGAGGAAGGDAVIIELFDEG